MSSEKGLELKPAKFDVVRSHSPTREVMTPRITPQNSPRLDNIEDDLQSLEQPMSQRTNSTRSEASSSRTSRPASMIIQLSTDHFREATERFEHIAKHDPREAFSQLLILFREQTDQVGTLCQEVKRLDRELLEELQAFGAETSQRQRFERQLETYMAGSGAQTQVSMALEQEVELFRTLYHDERLKHDRLQEVDASTREAHRVEQGRLKSVIAETEALRAEQEQLALTRAICPKCKEYRDEIRELESTITDMAQTQKETADIFEIALEQNRHMAFEVRDLIRDTRYRKYQPALRIDTNIRNMNFTPRMDSAKSSAFSTIKGNSSVGGPERIKSRPPFSPFSPFSPRHPRPLAARNSSPIYTTMSSIYRHDDSAGGLESIKEESRTLPSHPHGMSQIYTMLDRIPHSPLTSIPDQLNHDIKTKPVSETDDDRQSKGRTERSNSTAHKHQVFSIGTRSSSISSISSRPVDQGPHTDGGSIGSAASRWISHLLSSNSDTSPIQSESPLSERIMSTTDQDSISDTQEASGAGINSSGRHYTNNDRSRSASDVSKMSSMSNEASFRTPEIGPTVSTLNIAIWELEDDIQELEKRLASQAEAGVDTEHSSERGELSFGVISVLQDSHSMSDMTNDDESKECGRFPNGRTNTKSHSIPPNSLPDQTRTPASPAQAQNSSPKSPSQTHRTIQSTSELSNRTTEPSDYKNESPTVGVGDVNDVGNNRSTPSSRTESYVRYPDPDSQTRSSAQTDRDKVSAAPEPESSIEASKPPSASRADPNVAVVISMSERRESSRPRDTHSGISSPTDSSSDTSALPENEDGAVSGTLVGLGRFMGNLESQLKSKIIDVSRNIGVRSLVYSEGPISTPERPRITVLPSPPDSAYQSNPSSSEESSMAAAPSPDPSKSGNEASESDTEDNISRMAKFGTSSGHSIRHASEEKAHSLSSSSSSSSALSSSAITGDRIMTRSEEAIRTIASRQQSSSGTLYRSATGSPIEQDPPRRAKTVDYDNEELLDDIDDAEGTSEALTSGSTRSNVKLQGSPSSQEIGESTDSRTSSSQSGSSTQVSGASSRPALAASPHDSYSSNSVGSDSGTKTSQTIRLSNEQSREPQVKSDRNNAFDKSEPPKANGPTKQDRIAKHENQMNKVSVARISDASRSSSAIRDDSRRSTNSSQSSPQVSSTRTGESSMNDSHNGQARPSKWHKFSASSIQTIATNLVSPFIDIVNNYRRVSESSVGNTTNSTSNESSPLTSSSSSSSSLSSTLSPSTISTPSSTSTEKLTPPSPTVTTKSHLFFSTTTIHHLLALPQTYTTNTTIHSTSIWTLMPLIWLTLMILTFFQLWSERQKWVDVNYHTIYSAVRSVNSERWAYAFVPPYFGMKVEGWAVGRDWGDGRLYV